LAAHLKLEAQASAATSILSPDLRSVAGDSAAVSPDKTHEDPNAESDEEDEDRRQTPRDQIFGDFNEEVKRYRELRKQMKNLKVEEQAMLAREESKPNFGQPPTMLKN
jgi:hypothetical protein